MTEPNHPIIVTGTPRSGKSLLANILRRSPDVALVREPQAIWDIGIGNRPDDRRLAQEATGSVRRRIRRACQARVRKLGKKRYLDDLSYHALRIPFLHRVMPEAKIIHVIRSGEEALPEMLFGWTYRDTVGKAMARRRSSLRLGALPRQGLRFARNYIMSRIHGRRVTWGPRVPGLAEMVARRSPAEVAAYQWRMMVEIARDDLAQLPAESVLEVRFEELIGDPAAVAQQAARFCRLPEPGPVATFAAEVVDAEFEFERKAWPEEAEWEAVHEIIDPLQRELGYGST